MPRFTTASAGQPAPQASRTTIPTMPEWGPTAPAEAEWELPPVVAPERPLYEAPPTGFESAPPPMAPRAFVPPAPAPTVVVPAAAAPAPAPAAMPPAPLAPPAPAGVGYQTGPTPTIDDLFSQPSHMPSPAAPGPALPFAFLPPPKAADRSDMARPATDDSLLSDFDDPDMTMIASRRGKTKFWTLDLPDGSVEVVVGSVIVGRAASPVQGRVGARLLSIEDPTRSVSKNHAIFTDENGVLLVEDLGSMNGIVVTRADGHETELSPGIRLRLDHGSTVELGDLLLTVYKN